VTIHQQNGSRLQQIVHVEQSFEISLEQLFHIAMTFWKFSHEQNQNQIVKSKEKRAAFPMITA
jgi:hypothetical protein